MRIKIKNIYYYSFCSLYYSKCQECHPLSVHIYQQWSPRCFQRIPSYLELLHGEASWCLQVLLQTPPHTHILNYVLFGLHFSSPGQNTCWWNWGGPHETMSCLEVTQSLPTSRHSRWKVIYTMDLFSAVILPLQFHSLTRHPRKPNCSLSLTAIGELGFMQTHYINYDHSYNSHTRDKPFRVPVVSRSNFFLLTLKESGARFESQNLAAQLFTEETKKSRH